MPTSTPTPTVSLVIRMTTRSETAEKLSRQLAAAQALANNEAGTLVWFALRTDETTFWIVDAFATDEERQAHIVGPMAQAFAANSEKLLVGPPEILPAEVLASKLPQPT